MDRKDSSAFRKKLDRLLDEYKKNQDPEKHLPLLEALEKLLKRYRNREEEE
ncbi:MAG: hypothetical protein AAFV95_01630 [Bacteroidota bacterium]